MTDSQMVCIGVVLLAVTGISHKFAQAQTVPTTNLSATGGCSLGSTAFTSNEEECRKAGGVFYPQGKPITFSGPTIAGTISITNSVKNCEAGWSMVMTSGGYMCARELREPK